MSSQDDDFRARMKRVKARSGDGLPMPSARRAVADNTDESASIWPLLRPQLALVLGVIAMVAGRAFAMHSLMIEPDTQVLGPAEGAVVLAILAGLGLMLFRRDVIAQGALVVGAALGFLLEGYFIPVMPGLMSSLYTPEYVALVILNGS